MNAYQKIWNCLTLRAYSTYSQIQLRLLSRYGVRMSEAAISARLREMANKDMTESKFFSNKTNKGSHKRWRRDAYNWEV